MKQTIDTKCFYCGYDEVYILADKLRFEVLKPICKCVNCGLVFIKPPFVSDDPAFYENEYRAYYQAPLAKEYFESQIPEAKFRLDKIASHLSKQMKIMEIGSAAGSMLTVLKDAGYENVCGLEPDKNYSQYAIEQAGHNVYQGLLEQVELPENEFDAIICFHVFEHSNDPTAFLNRVFQVLKPGGVFIAEVPNVDDYLISLVNLKAYKDFYYQPSHNFYFSAKTAFKFLDKSAFERLNVLHYHRYSVFNGLNWLLKAKPTGLTGGIKQNWFTEIIDVSFKNLLQILKITDTIVVSAHKPE